MSFPLFIYAVICGSYAILSLFIDLDFNGSMLGMIITITLAWELARETGKMIMGHFNIGERKFFGVEVFSHKTYFGTIRKVTIMGEFLDEIAYEWRGTLALPDHEIIYCAPTRRKLRKAFLAACREMESFEVYGCWSQCHPREIISWATRCEPSYVGYHKIQP